MAKTCPSCGATLPRRALKCPKCGTDVSSGTGAALFTSMNAETESWQIKKEDSELKKKTVKYVKRHKTNVLMTVLGIVLAAVVVFFVIFNLPLNRMNRMFSSGRYEEAYTLYQNKYGESALSEEKMDKALTKACAEAYEKLNSGSFTVQEASDALASLESYGMRSTAFDQESSRLIRLIGSRNSMEQAKTYYDAMDWENAARCYESVTEDDSGYQEARTLMSECYENYGKAVAVSAKEMCEAGSSDEAVPYVKETITLLESKEIYCSDLYDALDSSCLSLEGYLLEQANTLCSEGQYDEATAALNRYEELTGETSEAIEEEKVQVQTNLGKNQVVTASAKAQELYKSGDVSGAFSLMDDLMTSETADPDDAQTAYTALEEQYYEDISKQFTEKLAGSVSNLKDALAIVTDAIAVHETDKLDELESTYEEYLPVSLIDALYTDKQGTVLRSSDGWMWGTDGSTITFATSGTYDYLEGTFGIQRTDNSKISGYFEVYSDKELIYTSDKLGSDAETVSFRLDISSVNFLVIKFVCNYEASTADGGYCYHAIYSPVIERNLP